MNKNNPLEVLGHISWLWASSSLHRNWPISLFAINVLPAIRANQYALLTRDSFPIAYCSWANLNLENEIKYLNDVTSLVAEDWTSGDRKWFIDWIAPFGDNGALYKYMRKNFPNELFRAIRVDPKTQVGKVSEFHGGKIDKQLANKLFKQYHYELITEVKNKSDFNFSLIG
ncbi:alpha-hemolysin-activating lysine-acyltransferase HlyC [Proteus mirabilis]|uniref:alpha-hemolysin-activating lysine-acyltransferase HlyC n=1 Tax=Proteus mirabilis TaxID=584 RepID=UPI0033148065